MLVLYVALGVDDAVRGKKHETHMDVNLPSLHQELECFGAENDSRVS